MVSIRPFRVHLVLACFLLRTYMAFENAPTDLPNHFQENMADDVDRVNRLFENAGRAGISIQVSTARGCGWGTNVFRG